MFTQNLNPTQKTLIPLREALEVLRKQAASKPLETTIKEVCQRTAPVWPLANFIAVNPLQGFETEPFKKAVEIAGKLFHAEGVPDLEYFHRQFRKGRITREDVVEALESLDSKSSVESLTQVLV
ncbi:DUF2309 family protein, partial [bacterium]|nr:DUF2309 family protein [bacterium]